MADTYKLHDQGRRTRSSRIVGDKEGPEAVVQDRPPLRTCISTVYNPMCLTANLTETEDYDVYSNDDRFAAEVSGARAWIAWR
jgi:hypothetical protein